MAQPPSPPLAGTGRDANIPRNALRFISIKQRVIYLRQTSARQLLKEYYGYDCFREGQEQLIDSIIEGRDSLGVMPTGAGKSICFQIPAMLLDGITFVISPLISLMKDQVNALTQLGIKAAYLNSSLTERQAQITLENAKYGKYKIIYIAPERLEGAGFLDFAQNVDISMVTVDEAHCISQWGQDFRPSYIKIADFLEALPRRPVVSAFTATATATVRDDIVNLLKLQEPTVLITGFDRKNLFFEVQKPKDKILALTNFLGNKMGNKRGKSGIIYCATRKAVEDVCDKLNESGFSATRYHAGLPDGERRDNQDDFLYDRVQIMVATNAFGMGIDKSNVSFVVHYNMPKNIESYYQEAGRAGRDGESADCVLLYSGKDVITNQFLIENSRDIDYPDPETEKVLKERDRQRLKEMTFYCHTNDCLRAYILKYFGEKTGNFCGNCSNCQKDFERLDVTVDAQKILSCISRTKERFGAKMIIDILRGSKNSRIMQWGFDKLSTYNISGGLSEKRLRDIINHLVLNGFLCITDDEYPILKLGARANEVLRGNTTIEMKLDKDIEKPEKAEKTTKTAKRENKPLKARPVNKELFDKLRALRLEIANEQNVPAFVIFTDSSLTDMCMKLPADKEEFLQVSGVGQVKLERYGGLFLKTISEFLRGNSTDTSDNESAELPDSEGIEILDEAITISMNGR